MLLVVVPSVDGLAVEADPAGAVGLDAVDADVLEAHVLTPARALHHGRAGGRLGAGEDHVAELARSVRVH